MYNFSINTMKNTIIHQNQYISVSGTSTGYPNPVFINNDKIQYLLKFSEEVSLTLFRETNYSTLNAEKN